MMTSRTEHRPPRWGFGDSELRAEVTGILERGGVVFARTEASWLLEDASSPERARDMALRRAAGEPLQYILGTAAFRRVEVEVGPGVFIPRPETEVVTEVALSALPPRGTIVDVCTGSGAIALAIATERPDARVLATELAPRALEWAVGNRDRLALRVELIECDLLSGLPGDLYGKIDVVVSNPPYVAEKERHLLPRDVADHEPHDALFAGPEGLDIIDRLIVDARPWLVPEGTIVIEIAETQADSVQSLLSSWGYDDIRIERDLAGRDRIAVAVRRR